MKPEKKTKKTAPGGRGKAAKKDPPSPGLLYGRLIEPLSKLGQMTGEVYADLFPPQEVEQYEVFLDLFESDGLLVLEAALPGIDPQEIELTVDSESVFMKGDVLESEDFNEEEAFIIERLYGSFSRTISLPYNVDPNRVEGFYRDGILRVEMPIEEDADYPPRKIEINAS
jgi:HSP20 family protein